MKQSDIIRLGIIAIALILGYNAIMCVIGVIDFLLDLMITDYKQAEQGFFNLLLKLACFSAACYLLIKNSRKISVFIDEQK